MTAASLKLKTPYKNSGFFRSVCLKGIAVNLKNPTERFEGWPLAVPADQTTDGDCLNSLLNRKFHK